MKGVIFIATKELILSRFGKKKWDEIIKNSGLSKEPVVVPMSNLDDALFLRIISSIQETLNLTLSEVASAFGDYWINTYSPALYREFYNKAKNAKEFLLNTANIHEIVTENMDDAHPPKFIIRERGNSLIMEYKSRRKLIEIAVGIINGVGKYYNEQLEINKIGENKIEIIFDY